MFTFASSTFICWTTKLFDMLRDIAISQQILTPNSGLDDQVDKTSNKLAYSFLGRPVCRSAFAMLMGVSWSPRLGTLLRAVLEGKRVPPMDPRYMSKKFVTPRPVYSEVFSYLSSLYESVAETLPLDEGKGTKGNKGKDPGVWSEDEDSYCVHATAPGSQEIRYLPPGTVFDLWRQYNSTTTGQKCSWHTFHSCWSTDFSGKLAFRDKYLFSICPVCVQYKLLIRHLGNDLNGRVRQRALYDRHLAAQYADRKIYWSVRANSRLHSKQIVCIIDGMDQGKYATPRSKVFESHSFDKYSRPRLHVWGLLCHGYIAWLSVSDSDLIKGGSTTCELLMHMITTLKNHGVEVEDCEIIVQLDNTGSSNKNNCVMNLASYLTHKRCIRKMVLSFLRVGHTHEEPGPKWGLNWVLQKPTNLISQHPNQVLVKYGSVMPSLPHWYHTVARSPKGCWSMVWIIVTTLICTSERFSGLLGLDILATRLSPQPSMAVLSEDGFSQSYPTRRIPTSWLLLWILVFSSNLAWDRTSLSKLHSS